MTKEFNLSEKIEMWKKFGLQRKLIPSCEVKEFIRLLKEEMRIFGRTAQISGNTKMLEGYRFGIKDCLEEIDKLAGKKLI